MPAPGCLCRGDLVGGVRHLMAKTWPRDRGGSGDWTSALVVDCEMGEMALSKRVAHERASCCFEWLTSKEERTGSPHENH